MSNSHIIFILILFLFFGCENDPNEIEEQTIAKKLQIESYVQTDIPEASGLCAIKNTNLFYTISDRPTNTLYLINREGAILNEIHIDATDIEGITINSHDSTIWLADEGASEIICLNQQGDILNNYEVNYGQIKTNNGLEGITYNSMNKHFYLITEKNPALLIQWSITDGIVNETQLYFADDYSAITYDDQLNKLWITSDESSAIFLCELSGDTIKSYSLPMKTPINLLG